MASKRAKKTDAADEAPPAAAAAAVAAASSALVVFGAPEAAQKRSRDEADSVGVTEELTELALKIIGRTKVGSAHKFDERFRCHFGISVSVAVYVWGLLLLQDERVTSEHMEGYLWGLLLLMCYNKTSVNCSLASGVDEDTFRKWAWWFVYQISFLEEKVVSRSPRCRRSVRSVGRSVRFGFVDSLLSLFALCRPFGRIAKGETKGMTA